MVKCPSCGANVSSGDKRCSKCGAKLEEKNSNKNSSKLIIAVVAVIAVIAVVGIFASGMLTNNSNTQVSDTSNVQTVNPVDNQQNTSNSQSSSDSSSGPFWASSKTDKFHKPNCEWAQKISENNKIVYNTRDEAIASGKVPCSVCNP